MGFIERLKKAKEKEQRRLQEAKERKEEEEKGKRDLEASMKERLKQRRLQANIWFQKSSFPKLLKGLLEVTNRPCGIKDVSDVEKGFLYGPSYDVWKIISADSVAIKFFWDQKNLGLYDHQEKALVIEAKYSGEITVHGGFLGSSNLAPREWEGNELVQEKALEKAYYHPRVVRYHWEPPLPEDHRP